MTAVPPKRQDAPSFLAPPATAIVPLAAVSSPTAAPASSRGLQRFVSQVSTSPRWTCCTFAVHPLHLQSWSDMLHEVPTAHAACLRLFVLKICLFVRVSVRVHAFMHACVRACVRACVCVLYLAGCLPGRVHSVQCGYGVDDSHRDAGPHGVHPTPHPLPLSPPHLPFSPTHERGGVHLQQVRRAVPPVRQPARVHGRHNICTGE